MGLLHMWWQLCTPGLLLTGITTAMEQGAWGHYQLSNPPFLVQYFHFGPVCRFSALLALPPLDFSSVHSRTQSIRQGAIYITPRVVLQCRQMLRCFSQSVQHFTSYLRFQLVHCATARYSNTSTYSVSDALGLVLRSARLRHRGVPTTQHFWPAVYQM